ncbi:MAG TPA: c-type cytochrome [Usitatibacteraceae bacterium]|jgi:cytochrome c|nr:c-type cytochrome [Usitatibacteraceae bacterium]
MRLASAIAAAAIAIGAPAAMAAPAGNAVRGEALYERCFACHSLETDRAGPRHCGLLGRRAGSVPGFDYSPAMRAAGIVWSAETLDRFLAAPTAVVPGTSMGYAGIASAQERADLIAYLRAARCPA